jgi:hypothetical protein
MDKVALSQQPYLTFFSDDTAEYDVIVDQSSSAPNLKEATWGALQPLLPLVAERMGPEEFALVLEYSPMPESFLEKMKAIQEAKAQQPPPPDPEVMKIEAMKQAKAAELEMRQQEAVIDAQLEQQKTGQQLQMEQQKAMAQLELERQKAAAEIQLEREKAAAQIELERQRNAVNMTMEREKMGFEQERMRGEMDLKAKSARSEMALKAGMAKVDAEEGFDLNGEDLDIFGNKALSGALTQMAQAMSDMARSNAESQRMMAEGVAALGSELKEAMTKPKQIVRGPDGRAIGVQ